MPGAPRKKSPPRRAAKTLATKKPAKKVTKPAGKVAKPAKPRKKTAKPAAKTARRATGPAKRPAKAPTKMSTKAPAKAPTKSAKVAPKPAKSAKPAKTTKGAGTAPPRGSASTKPAGKATVTKIAPERGKAGSARKKTIVCELSGFEVTPSTPQLSSKTLDRLRQKLIEEKQRLAQQADELTAEAEQLATEREAGDTQFDEESGEGDTVNVERERDLLLSASARQVIEEIDEALARMKKNNYGVCKYAGRKLPLERLEAIPWANVCVDCKARAERRR
jgi:RNA polymerase-binding protein DksA